MRPKTRSSYATATRDYERYCLARNLSPWPARIDVFCGWVMSLPKGGRVSMRSVPMYMAGVRFSHGLQSMDPWPAEGSEMVRRVMRFLKRKYPVAPTASKVPVTVQVICSMLRLLPGWPDLGLLSRDDLVFAVASVLATSGFLRGGEFLSSPGSDRCVLLLEDVVVRRVGSALAVVIRVRQPKARWWFKSASVPCFASPGDDEFCPVRLWMGYTAILSASSALRAGGPALVMANGRSLSRAKMVSWTAARMGQANITFVDSLGRAMAVKASSWRAGGVLSAVQAKVPEPFIRAFGRWASSSWTSYLMVCPLDMQVAARSIWAGRAPLDQLERQRVGAFDARAFLAPGDDLAMLEALPAPLVP